MTDLHSDTPRYAAQELLALATDLLERAGLSHQRAAVVAEILLEGDLMGHSTHGLHLLAPYLGQLESGSMSKTGEPIMVADHGASVTWDGRYLPGPWLVTQAMKLAFERIQDHPVFTIAIRHSHHIACLAAYLKQATDNGLLMILASSDPNEKLVAPFGGMEPLYTPNPIAAGIPTESDPILIDVSMSATAFGLVGQHQQSGQPLPGQWLLDNQGNLSDDPAVVSTQPPGSILPLGGADLGYKGFALGLLVEALTSALAGHGRSSDDHQWGASVFLQIINPDAFGGRTFFTQETAWLANASRNNPTQPGKPPVRVPGDRALALRAEQLQNGVALYPTIIPALQKWSQRYDVQMPRPL